MKGVEVGDLYEIIDDDFFSSGEHRKRKENGRSVIVKTNLNKGEIIEIRYPYAWHFRTIDGEYFHAEPEEIESKCKPFGKIKEETRFNNKKSLKEILEENLYDKAKQGVIV